MPGRSHKPLFEHLSKDQPEPASPLRRPDREPRRVSEPERLPRQGRLDLSYGALYGVIAGGIVLAIITWSLGYRIGYAAGKDAWPASTDRPLPQDPLAQTPLTQDSQNQPGPQNQTPAQQVSSPPAGTSAERGTSANPNATPVLTSRGPAASDPRVHGMNYLELATVTREQAEGAIAFLASNGVQAIGVPVDLGRSGANNPARYRLVSIELAIPGEQFRAMRTQRLDHERLIQRLGAEWQKQHHGASDFAQPLWKRYP